MAINLCLGNIKPTYYDFTLYYYLLVCRYDFVDLPIWKNIISRDRY